MPFGATTYFFTPPTIGDEQIAVGHRLWEFFRCINRGVSILKTNGTYTQVRTPTQDQVRDADIAYIGGYRYPISAAESDALNAAGYQTEAIFG